MRKSKVSLNKLSFFEEDKKINCCKNQYLILKVYDSVRERQPGVSYFPTIPFGSVDPESRIFPTIPFGSVDPESRIFLRFRSGASTRSLVFSFDLVQLYSLKSYFSDKMSIYSFCPIPNS